MCVLRVTPITDDLYFPRSARHMTSPLSHLHTKMLIRGRAYTFCHMLVQSTLKKKKKKHATSARQPTSSLSPSMEKCQPPHRYIFSTHAAPLGI